MHTEPPRPAPASLYAAALLILIIGVVAALLPLSSGARRHMAEAPGSTQPSAEEPVALWGD